MTLEELLLSRDRRVEHQRELLDRFPGASLICFTVMLPGLVKRDGRSLTIASAGLAAIRHALSVHPVDPQSININIMANGHSGPLSAIETKTSCHFDRRPEGGVEKSFILFEEVRDLETGFEAYFVVDMAPLEAKQLCCRIEDSHPLGRLMDIDVIVCTMTVGPVASCRTPFRPSGSLPLAGGGTTLQEATGPAVRPLSRGELGLPERSCLLCDKPARECMRAHRHSPQEIQDTIDRMVQDYNSR